MRKGCIMLGLLCLFGPLLWGQAADPDWKEKALAFQKEQNKHFKSFRSSPLTAADRKQFRRLHFFDLNPDFCVKAALERSPEAPAFEIPTSSGKNKRYFTFGVLHFSIRGDSFALPVYQNVEHVDHPKYHNLLFLPFTDLTSGEETYGGGRYMDLEIPEGDELILDFNHCYNPYCAYSTGWSCPIPPQANFLEIRVEAGTRAGFFDKKGKLQDH